jgi:peptidoglycan/LPS O-acetylase OafA/YrhL
LALAFCLLPFPVLAGYEPWALTLPMNVLLIQAWIPAHAFAMTYNAVAWSLSVEAFFYFTFPWLLGITRKRGPGLLLTGAFLLGLALVVLSMLWIPSRAGLVASLNPLCRVFEFILGMATCRLWMSGKEKRIGASSWLALEILALAVTYTLATAVPLVSREANAGAALVNWVGTEIVAVDFACVIWIFAHQRGALAQVLSSRGFEWLGQISFSFYMCHQLLIRRFFPAPSSQPLEALKSFLLLTVLTLIVSAALFHFVETPARRGILATYKRCKSRTTPIAGEEVVSTVLPRQP